MKKLYLIGQWVMIAGAVLYLADIVAGLLVSTANAAARYPALYALTCNKSFPAVEMAVLSCIFGTALVLMLIARIGGAKKKS